MIMSLMTYSSKSVTQILFPDKVLHGQVQKDILRDYRPNFISQPMIDDMFVKNSSMKNAIKTEFMNFGN